MISPLLASFSPALGGVLAPSVGLVGSVWRAEVVWGVGEAAEWRPAEAPAAAAVVVVKGLECAAAPDACVVPRAPFCSAPWCHHHPDLWKNIQDNNSDQAKSNTYHAAVGNSQLRRKCHMWCRPACGWAKYKTGNLVSTCIFTSDHKCTALSAGVNTHKMQWEPITQTTSSHSLSSVNTACPGPHRKTAYSTDVLYFPAD